MRVPKNYLLFIICLVIACSLISCKSEKIDCLCFSTPSFPVYITNYSSIDSNHLYLVTISGVNGVVVDSLYIGNRFKSLVDSNGKQIYQFQFNEADEFYKGSDLSGFNYLFINLDSNFIDTLQNISWDTERTTSNCKTRENKDCERMFNISFEHDGQKYSPLEKRYFLW